MEKTLIKNLDEKYEFTHFFNFMNSVMDLNNVSDIERKRLISAAYHYLDKNLSDDEKLDLYNIYENNKELINKLKDNIIPNLWNIYEFWLYLRLSEKEKMLDDIKSKIPMVLDNIEQNKKVTSFWKKLFKKK